MINGDDINEKLKNLKSLNNNLRQTHQHHIKKEVRMAPLNTIIKYDALIRSDFLLSSF